MKPALARRIAARVVSQKKPFDLFRRILNSEITPWFSDTLAIGIQPVLGAQQKCENPGFSRGLILVNDVLL
jgi:hypothetical protein